MKLEIIVFTLVDEDAKGKIESSDCLWSLILTKVCHAKGVLCLQCLAKYLNVKVDRTAEHYHQVGELRKGGNSNVIGYLLYAGEVGAFKFKAVKTFKKCLERQVFEGCSINRSNADIKMNSKAEWNQPSEIRVTFTRHTEERARTRSLGS